MNRRAAVCVALLVPCAALAAAAARAEEGAGVEVRIGAVVASNSAHEAFDQRLASLRRPFQSLFPYSSYRLIKEERRKVQWGGRAGFHLPGGRYLLVMPKEYKAGRVSLKLILIDGSRPLVDTLLALRNQGTFLVGGPRHQEGVLIISIGCDTTM